MRYNRINGTELILAREWGGFSNTKVPTSEENSGLHNSW